MDQSLNVQTVNVGTISGTVVQPLFRVPSSDSAFGGITITKAYIWSSATVTNELQLLTGTALGTATTGTIGTLNATLTAQVPQAFTVSTPYVASGKWIHLKTNAGGGTGAVTNVIVEYKWGK